MTDVRSERLTTRLVRPIRTSSVRRRHLAPSIFSIIPDGAVRRRPSDVVRCALAALGVVVTAASVQVVSDTEHDVYDLLTDVPRDLDWIFRIGYWALPAVVVAIAIGAIVARRTRLGLALALSAALALVIGLVLDAVVGAEAADNLRATGADLSRGAPDYPPIAFAVAVAAVFAGRAYLTRPAKRIVDLLILFGAISAIVLIEGLPAAVVGALAIAWGVASAVRLVFGTPAGTPTTSEVRAALHEWDIEPATLELASEQVWGESRFVATTDDGTVLRVAAIGRDANDARLVATIWRSIWYKDAGPRLALSRQRRVEHGAYLLLLARRAGVVTPDVVAAGTAGDLDHALLVTQDPAGRALSAIDEHLLTDEVLRDAWGNLDRLHAAHLAHGQPSLDNVELLADGTTALVGFDRTSSSAPPERMAHDNAELLAATAARVGVAPALDAAAATIGSEALEQTLPLLEPSALSKGTRKAIAKDDLTALREQAAARLGIEVPQTTELRRVSPANLGMAAGAILGVYLLIGELADVKGVGDVFSDIEWAWVPPLIVASQTPQFAQAIGMLGSVSQQLPLGPATAVQFANQFMGLVGGTVATTAVIVRFFQKQGLAVALAVTSGVLNTLATMITQAILVIVGLLLTASDFDLSMSDRTEGGGGDASTFIWILIAVAGVSGAALLVPRLRHRVGEKLRPQFSAARDNLRDIWGQPRKALQLFGGNVASQLLFALTLQIALRAYGESLPIMQLIVINSFASVLGGIAPVPGGMGVIEAGLIGGFTAAGIPESQAIAATFTARLWTAYLPPIWGWFSLNWLRRHDYV
jgi:uncharacterized membrane protein YbhN (UPF0104 family)